MKIIKYIKLKDNTYKIDFDDRSQIFYGDVITKHELLLKKNIKEKEYLEMCQENQFFEAYYKVLKFISRKMRTRKEVEEFLSDFTLSNNDKDKIIKKLEDKNFLNDDIYIKSFIHDAIKLGNDGELKIKNKLIQKGFESCFIDEYLKKIDYTVWTERVNKIILKKLEFNRRDSEYVIKNKILNFCLQKGYSYQLVKECLDEIKVKNSIQVVEKIKLELEKKLAKRYHGEELLYQIKNKLIQKGFDKELINEVIKK